MEPSRQASCNGNTPFDREQDIPSLPLSSESSKRILSVKRERKQIGGSKNYVEQDHYTPWNDLVTATVIVKERKKDRYNIPRI